MKISVQFFGTFRNFGESINFEITHYSKVKDVKDKIFDILKAQAGNATNLNKLIQSSRLSTDTCILNENDFLKQHTHFAILPPV